MQVYGDCTVTRSLNRSVLIIKAKQSYIDFSGYDSSKESWAVLVPDLQDQEQCILYIKEKLRFQKYFKEALEDTGKAESTFPDTTSFEVFVEWFELEYSGLVYDSSDDYLPIAPSKFDLYFREGTPSWYIGSGGMLNETEWNDLKDLESFSNFESGYSNQLDKEK